MPSRLIPPERDLHLAPDLPPHPNPLEWVYRGSHQAGFVDPSLPLDPFYHPLLERVLRLAQNLITHPRVLPEAAKLIGETNTPDVLILKAIRRVLATRRWRICLDDGGGGPSWHESPSKLTWAIKASETTLFFSLPYAERLLRAFSAPDELDFARQMIMTALPLAGTLLHAIRLQVKVELLRYPECRIVLDHGQGNHECACWLECLGFGGIVECGWDYERPREESLTPLEWYEGRKSKFDFDALMAADKAAHKEDMRIYHLLNRRPIDFLSLRPKSPGRFSVTTRHRIPDDWVLEAHRLYQADRIHELELPIPYEPEPLEYKRYELVSYRQDRVTCRMGYRTPEIREPRYTSLESIPAVYERST